MKLRVVVPSVTVSWRAAMAGRLARAREAARRTGTSLLGEVKVSFLPW
jgi:hypothetical protein